MRRVGQVGHGLAVEVPADQVGHDGVPATIADNLPEPQCPQGWPINPDTGQRDGPCGLIGCCARPGPQSNASNEDATEMTDLAAPQPGDHPHTDPGDGRTECERCGKYVWPAIHSCKGVPVTARAQARAQGSLMMSRANFPLSREINKEM